ncbi:DUF4073 domain-containing protein [Paenibacillus illinoisensis]|uniref:DUF4073 domain-containing protein n=1 Tax=Paenibacillus illinoisensis TaxID=59845 RepID=UPI001C8E02FC|nr:DUF4073 domain-containing protein [Paenibacillus illinoisensis]MBY0217676.1 DUF4073 domain-containing protein [Paenibacillus illinoisensis]
MFYRKLVSCLLVAVLFLQVVSVGGVANAASTPLEQLNEIRKSDQDIEQTISQVQSLIENSSLIDTIDKTTLYDGLDEEQKKELARGMTLLLPLGTDYKDQSQVDYMFLLLSDIVELPRVMNPSAVQGLLNELYNYYSQAGNFLPSEQAQPMIEASAGYSMLRGADKEIFTNIVMFEPALGQHQTPINYKGQIQLLNVLMSDYLPINRPITGSDMVAALNSLYAHYQMTWMIGMNPNATVQPFPINMEKMSTIQNNEQRRAELADWMIYNRTGFEGYNTSAEVQAAFDAFFAVAAPAVTADDEANTIVDADGTMEYSTNAGVDWFVYSSTNLPQFEGAQTVWVRVKATESTPVGPYVTLTFTENRGADPLEALNLAKSNEDVAGVLAAVQDPQVGVILPQDFGNWTKDEKESMAEFLTLMNGSKGYVSKDQVQYVIDLVVYPRNLLQTRDLLSVEQRVTTYFDMLRGLPDVFSGNMDSSISTIYSIGKKYNKLSAVDKQILAYNITFELMRSSTPLYQFKDQLTAELSTYIPINNLSNKIEMHSALVNLRLLQKESAQFNNDPYFGHLEDFPLNLDKVDQLEHNTYQELAQWMIDNRPVQGYESYQAIQQTFNAFFGPLSPMEQLNDAVDAENVGEVLTIIRNSPELVILPAGFNDLTLEEQLAVAQALIDLLPDKYDYENEGQVRYIVELAYEAVLAYKATSQDEMQSHLDHFYMKLSQVDEYISIEDFEDYEEFRELSKKYVEGSVVDQKLIAYMARLIFKEEGLSVDEAVLGMVMILTISPSLNVNTTDEMSQTLFTLLMIQQEVEEYNKQSDHEKLDDFPLNFSKLADASSDESRIEKLAQWMLDKKPANGYGSYTEVQSAFDEFFEPKTPVVTPPSSGGSGGGSSSTPVTSTPATNKETLTVDVNGTNGTNLVKTTITRTTETNGKVKDLVTMSEATAKESVEKAKQLGMDTARIIIPDAKDSVSETRIELPKAAVKQLNDGGLKLEISTENAIISIPTASTAGFDQDLYFRIVPMKQESERKQVEERAKQEQLIQQITPDANVKVLARPVEIETNMQSREVTLTLPLRDSLPTDAAARQKALDNLAIYIEHSDGTKELQQGKLVQLNDGSEGIEFTVSKFSTFTLVVVDGLKAAETPNKPYIKGFGDEFRPDAFVTRAQMAAMLARNLTDESKTTISSSFADVAATHWANSEIAQAQSAGIMNGMSATQFVPEGSITRAQMATIAYRWMQQQSGSASAAKESSASFTDVSTDSWAAEAIAYVQSAGLMTGYTDGTFKPDSQLSRAEAVKVLNVLFKRTPAAGTGSQSFSDVPASHWAYADIQAAAQQ